MDTPRKVVVLTADRSERGILEPVIKRLNQRTDVKLWVTSPERYNNEITGLAPYIPDVVLIPADRQEMVLPALNSYYKKIPVFHLWAGIGNTGTWDDLNRRVISSFAYLMLCEDIDCWKRLTQSGEEPWRCIITGTPHYDDMEVDERLAPDGPYDLVLVNPNPVDPQDEQETWDKVWHIVDKHTVVIDKLVVNLSFQHRLDSWQNLNRPQFLGLLKNCKRFVSNSSSMVYEAPYFGVEVVPVGNRNLYRKTRAEMEPGAADRIVNLLATCPLDKSKLLKVYH